MVATVYNPSEYSMYLDGDLIGFSDRMPEAEFTTTSTATLRAVDQPFFQGDATVTPMFYDYSQKRFRPKHEKGWLTFVFNDIRFNFADIESID